MISWRLMTMLTYEEACLTPKAKKPKRYQALMIMFTNEDGYLTQQTKKQENQALIIMLTNE